MLRIIAACVLVILGGYAVAAGARIRSVVADMRGEVQMRAILSGQSELASEPDSLGDLESEGNICLGGGAAALLLSLVLFLAGKKKPTEAEGITWEDRQSARTARRYLKVSDGSPTRWEQQ